MYMLRNTLFGLVCLFFMNTAFADDLSISMCTDMVNQQYKNHLTEKQAASYCQCNVPRMEALMNEAVEKGLSQEQINKRVMDNANYCAKKAGITADRNNQKSNSASKTEKQSGNSNKSKTSNSPKTTEVDKRSKLIIPGLK